MPTTVRRAWDGTLDRPVEGAEAAGARRRQRVDDEQVPGTGLGRAAGGGGDLGRRDHDHVGGRDGRGPGAAALSDLHSRVVSGSFESLGEPFLPMSCETLVALISDSTSLSCTCPIGKRHQTEAPTSSRSARCSAPETASARSKPSGSRHEVAVRHDRPAHDMRLFGRLDLPARPRHELAATRTPARAR